MGMRSVASRQILVAVDWKDVTGLGVYIEVQLDKARSKLPQYVIDASFNRGMVGSVTGHEFLDYRTQRRRR
jgi:hypothetical protein